MDVRLLQPPENLHDQLAAIDRSDLTPAEQSHLKIGVLRKILLTGWLQIAQIRTALNPTENQSRNDRQVQREGRKLLTSNLSDHLANVKLGKATLAKMDILPAPIASFPYYTLLPPEMQAHLLSFLDNPVDKLNVVEAIPLVDLLMRWDVGALVLEAFTIPKLLECEDIRKSNWKILEQLRNTSPYIREAINKRLLPHYLAQKLEFYNKWATFPLLINFQPSDRWTTLDPITAQVNIYIGMWENAEFVRRGVLHRLEDWVGPRVADCHLECVGYVTNIQLIQRIAQCLERMPNLQRLVIGTWDEEEDTWEDIQNLAMPPLASLKILVFREMVDGAVNPVCRKLLQCYAHQVNQVVMHFGIRDSPNSETFQYDWPAFPQLTTWKLESSPLENGWKFHGDMIERLVGSPLKVVRIALYASNNDQKDFVDFLKILCANFGNTLEELSIRARNTRRWQRTPTIKWMENMDNLTFPRITYLAIDQGCPESWDFLMLFPTLEKLMLTKLYYQRYYGKLAKFNKDAILKLNSSNLQTLRNSKVWKLFPNLQEIGTTSYADDMTDRVQERITRPECIAATSF